MPRAKRTAMRIAALALTVACIAPLADEASGDDASGDFHVDSSRPDDYAGTRQDIESNLTDELAVKLRQFDEWAVEREQDAAAAQAAGAQAGGSPGGDGGDANAHPNAGDAAAGGTAMVEADGRADATSASRPARNVPVPTAATRPTTADRRFPATYPQQPAKADRVRREDDVARMLREAAEQEDNPIRKQELMEQYEVYVRSL